MIGKIVNGIVVTPTENERKKIIITNPSEEILKIVMGYKDLVYDEEPEYDENTQRLEENIEETNTQINVQYVVKDIPILESTEGNMIGD